MKLKLILTTAIVGTALALPAASSAAPPSPPPTLTGESFHQDTPTITSITCTETEIGVSFEASGTATGPYPGTFQETGSALSIGDELTMSFTIDSPVGRVEGTKHSTTFGLGCGPLGVSCSGVADCDRALENGAEATFNTDPSGFIDTDLYGAVILTASGQFFDNGLFQAFLYPSDLGGFTERFESALAAPEQFLPTSKAQCENGGWKQFVFFKNQGQCIAFVNHGP